MNWQKLFALTVLTFAVAALGGVDGMAQEPMSGFEALLRRVPTGANAMVLVDARAIRGSELAKQQSRALGALAREINPGVFAPAEVERYVLASNLDTATMQALWETSLIESNVDISAAEIARFARGEEERLADCAAAHLPIGAYCAKLGAKSYGIYAPADRQMIARWIRAGEATNAANLSPYLKEMARFTDAGTQIILSLDLTDAISPAALREPLKASKSLASKAVNIDRLAELIASIRGVTLGIRFGEAARGSIRVDFGRDADTLKDVAKPLLLEALTNRHAMIDDMQQWTAEVKGSTVFLAGPLSLDGLRRVMSLIEPPSVPLSDPSKGRPEDQNLSTGVDPKAAASHKYFKSVRSLLDDLRHPDRDAMITIGQQALWFERYAKRIDQLPILNVDSDLLDYGARTAVLLRQVAGTQRNVGIDAGQQSANPTVSYSYGPGYDGTGYYGRAYDAYVGPSQRNVAKKIGTGEAARTQYDVLRAIDDDTAAIRRAMTQRYQIEF